MIRIISILLLFILLNLYLPKTVNASRSLIISSDKTSLFGEEEMQISASSSGFTSGEDILVKGAFYKDGKTNYFGYSKNGDSWIKNGETSQNQLKEKIGEWNNILNVKSDFADSGYEGEGEYKFKVGFYYTTSGGNLSSVNWSDNDLTISISEPDPTPTTTPQPTQTPTSTPSKTSTPIPTKTPTPIPTKTPTPKSSPSKIPIETISTESGEVLGMEVIKNDNPSPSPNIGISNASENKNMIIATAFVGLGMVLIGGSIYWVIKTSKSTGTLNDI
jgi:hypothetical protein